ncbi:winged helix DNA-binding domain-containing protein [Listeria sp. FSL L7-1509]|uniref:Winged helix DNA-binding domain-containing protein n=1 Tax=Listeria immobilis TaxID=2713502 RepID=A0ABR6SZB5_9LIST|nr:crosslink repair DNA glycosylase YcaQ family protein [Listeria immobilis]MBC1483770.1 winged helix DNA-binding domain-containing protein [Listeria immobilis]MBC1507961.1 winged helix DNA-binding domain-containing protein [Listeria immobilis]MBC1510947.1 winged helix DNA-binding domain-containing protein [Listeria immobilis]MBC6304114.1 winged helix DNA-binding domain-containing protein [Listeria immobilis]MBC6313592.1 winged helix DNA-binding domain-containing protein [Listeria immobilis]
MNLITNSEIVQNRLYNSGLLHNKFRSAPVASSALFGIQSQYQQFGEISLFNRVTNLTKKDLQSDYDQKKLIKIWGQRMTVHMYTPADWFFIHNVYAIRNNWIKKHTEALGYDLDALLEGMEQLLLSEEKIPKEAFAQLFGEQAKKLMTWGGVFIQGSLDGKLFCVPETPKTKFYSHRYWIDSETEKSWLTTSREHTGLEEMVERYFSAYGPATIQDFKHWTGLPNFEFQATLDKLLPTYFCYLGEDGRNYYSKAEVQKELKSEKPILLGKFDPLFVSYQKKDWLAAEKELSLIWRSAGQIEAVLILDDMFYGTWRYKITGEKIVFHFYLSKKMSKKNQKQTEKEAIQLALFLNKNYQGSKFEQI